MHLTTAAFFFFSADALRDHRNIWPTLDSSTKYPNFMFLPNDKKGDAKQIPDGIQLKQ